MKTIFDPPRLDELQHRIGQLRSDSARQWGKMTLPQALAHCTIGIETASGAVRPPRVLVGRILGGIIKPLALRDDEPMRRNSPTAPVFIVRGDPDFAAERDKLSASLGALAAAGKAACTSHPHAFFGKLTPEEWGILMYKHLDHHLRQFSA